MHQRESAAFYLSWAFVVICPDLEIVTETGIVVIIHDNRLLASVAIPPLVLGLSESIRPFGGGIEGFASARGAPYPDTSEFAWGCCSALGKPEKVQCLG